VENVSWNDAMEFCKKLSELPAEKAAKRVYRLPTEAEWEYACRADRRTTFFFGDDLRGLGDHAWYDKNSDGQTHAVGKKKESPWGLYDMYGNVWEWCLDAPRTYTEQLFEDGKEPQEPGKIHVLRGGSWLVDAKSCRSATRKVGADGEKDPYRSNDSGFRVVCEP
jgi:formylglycine-generating enzyme required for sulfatase activity